MEEDETISIMEARDKSMKVRLSELKKDARSARRQISFRGDLRCAEQVGRVA